MTRMKQLGPFQTMSIINFSLFIEERIHKGLFLGFWRSLLFFIPSSFFSITSKWFHCFILDPRSWLGSKKAKGISPSICNSFLVWNSTNSMLDQYLVNKITLRDTLLARGRERTGGIHPAVWMFELKSGKEELEFVFFFYLFVVIHPCSCF